MSQAKAVRQASSSSRDRLTSSLSEEAMAEIRAAYLEGVEGDLAALQDWLLHCKDDTRPWSECLTELRKIIHNVKGQGTSFGYPLMTDIGNSLHSLLSAAPAQSDQAVLKVIEAHIIALRTIIDERISGEGGPEGESVIQQLENLNRKALFGN